MSFRNEKNDGMSLLSSQVKRENALDTSCHEYHSMNDCNGYRKFTDKRKDVKKTGKRRRRRRCNDVNKLLNILTKQSKLTIIFIVVLVLFLVQWIVLLNLELDMKPDVMIRKLHKDKKKSTRKTKSIDIENLKFEQRTMNAPKCDRITDSSSIDFTLVSQLSEDRLWMLPYHCQRWGFNNKMSVVILSDLSIEEIHERIQPKCNPSSIHIQLVSTDDVPSDEYPVNTYRNMALSAVNTTHVAYVDIDFWESENLYSVLNNTSMKEKMMSDNKLLLIIPALQIPRMCQEYRDCPEDNVPAMPRNMQEVGDLHKEKLLTPFDPTNYGGHSSTEYSQWFYKQQEGELIDISCIVSNRYEPYTVFRYCQDTPPFQKQFTGYGKNKMTWTMQLRRAGYKFTQIGGVFVVHYPHLDSRSKIVWNKKLSKKRIQNDEIFIKFRSWLRKNIKNKSRTKLCVYRYDDDFKLHTHKRKKMKNHDKKEKHETE